MLARDWHHDREAVLDAIERALREPEPTQAPEPDAEAMPPAATAGASPVEAELVEPQAPMPTEETLPHPAPTPPAGATELPWRRLEFVEGSSRKFWQIRREDTDVVVAFGRIGTTGQSQRKPLADVERAQAELEKLVREKQRKGYLET